MWSSFLITAVGHVIRCTVLLGAWVPGLHCFTSVTPPAGYTCCLCRNVSPSASTRGEIREKRDPVSPHDREEPYPRLAYFWMPLPTAKSLPGRLIHKVNWWKYQQMHNKEESNHLKKKFSLPPFHYTVSEFETFLGPHLTQKGNVFKRKN